MTTVRKEGGDSAQRAQIKPRGQKIEKTQSCERKRLVSLVAIGQEIVAAGFGFGNEGGKVGRFGETGIDLRITSKKFVGAEAVLDRASHQRDRKIVSQAMIEGQSLAILGFRVTHRGQIFLQLVHQFLVSRRT